MSKAETKIQISLRDINIENQVKEKIHLLVIFYKGDIYLKLLILRIYLKFNYPKFTFAWNKPNKLLPTIAAIIKTKATIANRALTSFMS